jgi:sugar lactone lactonase YvrE
MYRNIYIFSLLLFIIPLCYNTYGESPEVYEYTSTLQIGHIDEVDSNYILSNPQDMVIDKQGNIIVLDNGNNRIVVYNNNLKFIKGWGRKGQGPGELIGSWYITLLGKTIAITNIKNSRIDFFNEDGMYLQSFKPGFKVETLIGYGEKEILTNSNTSPNLVNHYNTSGHLLGSFGEWIDTGSENKNFFCNTFIWLCTDSKGNIWLAFKTLPIIRKYNSKGELLFEIKIKDADVDKAMDKISKEADNVSAGGVTFITHDIRTDKDDNIYVLILRKLLMYSPDGNLLKVINQNKTEIDIFIDRIALTNNGEIYGLSMPESAVYRLDITKP